MAARDRGDPPDLTGQSRRSPRRSARPPRGSLLRHRDPQALLGRDEVIEVLGRLRDVDLDPLDGPGEAAALRGVVVTDRRGRVRADVARLIGREDHRDGGLDAALAGLRAVEVEGDGAALAEAAAVVGELHAHLMGAGWDRPTALDGEVLDAEQVVGVLGLAVLDVEAPAGERAALSHDHALGAA